MKNGKEKKKSFLSELLDDPADILEILMEFPILFVIVLALFFISLPLILYLEHKKKKKLIAQYGIIDCALNSFDRPISNVVEYIWEVSLRRHNKLSKVENKGYTNTNGYMNEKTFIQEINKLEKDDRAAEFILYHVLDFWKIDSLESTQTVIDLLHNRYFREANEFLENHRRNEQYWK